MISRKPIFIPIKENSQRVKCKNFREWGDKTLWRHTVDRYALSPFGCEVYIDTDSEEILEECKDIKNVTAYRREDHLVGDKVSVCDLIKNFANKFPEIEVACQIHVTNPFLDECKIFNAFNIYNDKNNVYDSIFSCNSVKSRFWRMEDHGITPINHNPMNLIQTQDLPEYLEENSCFYLFSTKYIKETGCRIGKNPLPVVINFPQNLDIDTEDDWELCLSIRKKYEKN